MKLTYKLGIMDILTKIAVTLIIITLTCLVGFMSTVEDSRLDRVTNVFGMGMLGGLAGLIICLIAWVWV